MEDKNLEHLYRILPSDSIKEEVLTEGYWVLHKENVRIADTRNRSLFTNMGREGSLYIVLKQSDGRSWVDISFLVDIFNPTEEELFLLGDLGDVLREFLSDLDKSPEKFKLY